MGSSSSFQSVVKDNFPLLHSLKGQWETKINKLLHLMSPNIDYVCTFTLHQDIKKKINDFKKPPMLTK